VWKRVLYVFGGTDIDGLQTNQVWAFDLSTNTWSSKSPMPTPRSSLGAIVGDGLIHVIGGYQGGARLNVVEGYDPVADTWTEETPMLVGKTEPSVGLIGKSIVVADGYTSSGDTGDNELYDQFTNKWYALPPDPTPRNSACTGSINSKIYIAGGFPGGGPGTPAINLVESFDSTKTWTTMSPIPQATLEAGAAVYDGALFCIGGWQAAYGVINNNVQIYHP
jgi:Kelch motif protein